MASPARPGAGVKSGVTSPIPVVLMKIPSALPRSTTFVSPVTSKTPAARAAPPIERTMRSSRSNDSPSSSTKPADR